MYESLLLWIVLLLNNYAIMNKPQKKQRDAILDYHEWRISKPRGKLALDTKRNTSAASALKAKEFVYQKPKNGKKEIYDAFMVLRVLYE